MLKGKLQNKKAQTRIEAQKTKLPTIFKFNKHHPPLHAPFPIYLSFFKSSIQYHSIEKQKRKDLGQSHKNLLILLRNARITLILHPISHTHVVFFFYMLNGWKVLVLLPWRDRTFVMVHKIE